MKNLPDIQILNLIKSEDRNAFNELYRRYYGKLKTYLRKHNSDDENEDILQDVFADLWMHRRKINVTTSVSAFVYSILKHKLYNYYRAREVKERSEGLIIQDNQYVEHHADLLDVKRMIKEKLETMPVKQKTAFKLSRFKYMTNKEIADHMHIRVRGVENYISAALTSLRPINNFYSNNL
jgi:RNA polymerase sigma-70 factor, ECF subfamily